MRGFSDIRRGLPMRRCGTFSRDSRSRVRTSGTRDGSGLRHQSTSARPKDGHSRAHTCKYISDRSKQPYSTSARLKDSRSRVRFQAFQVTSF